MSLRAAPPSIDGRVIPHSDGKISMVIIWRMKIKQNMELTFGDMTTARLVVFREQPHFLISSAKGRSV